MWIYESHLGGGYFANRRELSAEERYCDECCDYDWPVGDFPDAESFIKFVADDVDVDDSGGQNLADFCDSIKDMFYRDISPSEVANLVRKFRKEEDEECSRG